LGSRELITRGPYYWSFALAPPAFRKLLSYVTGWLYMLAIWMLDLGTHYGSAILIVGAVNIYHPDWVAPVWVTLVITYGIYGVSVMMTWKGHRWVPALDVSEFKDTSDGKLTTQTANAVFTGICLVVVTGTLLGVAAEGRRPASFVFTHYDYSFSGWGPGWTFFIGLLPGCFVMCGVGFICSMSEETAEPSKQVRLCLSCAFTH